MKKLCLLITCLLTTYFYSSNAINISQSQVETTKKLLEQQNSHIFQIMMQASKSLPCTEQFYNEQRSKLHKLNTALAINNFNNPEIQSIIDEAQLRHRTRQLKAQNLNIFQQMLQAYPHHAAQYEKLDEQSKQIKLKKFDIDYQLLQKEIDHNNKFSRPQISNESLKQEAKYLWNWILRYLSSQSNQDQNLKPMLFELHAKTESYAWLTRQCQK